VRLLREICVIMWLCGAMWLAAAPAHGQAPPPTLSSFLGIGADQQSSNPAIQAAAKAKAAKHQICKKKAAIQYLAGMGCSPEHPEVGAALLAAMGDPDEPVRYEAVKAVLQTAAECQSPEQKKAARKALGLSESLCDAKKKCEKKFCDCIDVLLGKAPPPEHKHKHKKLKDLFKPQQDPACDPKADCPQGNGRGPCCSPDMRAKLMELAYGRDEKGCFLEPSSRVREVAELALKACNACNGCGCDPMNSGSSGIRELPPVEERETAEYTGVFPGNAGKPGHCVVTDRAMPMYDQPAPEPTLAPEPAPPPTAPEPPAAEEIPTPAPCDPMVIPESQTLRSVLRQPSDRLASLPRQQAGMSLHPVAVLPPRPSVASVPPHVIRPKPSILTWPTIADALTAVQISETWLAANERLDVQAEFSHMVGETMGERFSYPPFRNQSIRPRLTPKPPLTPSPSVTLSPSATLKPPVTHEPPVTLKPPAPPVASKASRETPAPKPPLNPSLARVSAGVTSAMIGGGCLLLLLLAWLVGSMPMARHAAATRPGFRGGPRIPPAHDMASHGDGRAKRYPQKPRK
jgi:hypothetical protein